MAETKPIDKMTLLELENMSLRLHIVKRNCLEMEAKFLEAAEKTLVNAGLTKEEWAVDLDRGLLVKKS